MVREGTKADWKKKNYEKISKSLLGYEKCFIVCVDNVRSKQMQQIRSALRGQAELVMGKNTMIRKVLNTLIQQQPRLERLSPFIRENVGFVFTRADLNEIRNAISKNTVAAPAKAGAIAPVEVIIPQQNTGLGPEKTSFFQALNIGTKITRGTIEILNDVNLIKPGDKVGMSEATLLSMLKIYPFSYGLVIRQVFDQGSIYSPEVLDIKPDTILNLFLNGVRQVAAVSLVIGHPTIASAPHSVANGVKRLLALSLASGFEVEQAAQIRQYLADPSKFASAAGSKAAAPAEKSKPEAAASKPAAKPVEPEESSDEELGMGLFD